MRVLMLRMTKQEFDAATRKNHGGPIGNRFTYRASRGQSTAVDKVARRAREMGIRNSRATVTTIGYTVPTLGNGSRFRPLAAYCACTGKPLLSLG